MVDTVCGEVLVIVLQLIMSINCMHVQKNPKHFGVLVYERAVLKAYSNSSRSHHYRKKTSLQKQDVSMYEQLCNYLKNKIKPKNITTWIMFEEDQVNKLSLILTNISPN